MPAGLVIAALAASGGGTGASAVERVASAGSEQSQLDALPPGGEWVPYRAEPNSDRPARATAEAGGLVRAIERGCPAGTTDYPKRRAYNCLSTYRDNGNQGHSVGLRQGRSDPNGFGYLHAIIDHNLDEESIGTTIVNNAAGIAQGNNRYLYGLRYQIDSRTVVAVEVIEDRNASTASPDNYRLGVVTAYCKGYSGDCPPGVNAALP